MREIKERAHREREHRERERKRDVTIHIRKHSSRNTEFYPPYLMWIFDSSLSLCVHMEIHANLSFIITGKRKFYPALKKPMDKVLFLQFTNL